MLQNDVFLLAIIMLFLLLLLILLLSYLVVRKWVDVKKRQEIEKHKSKYKQLIFSYLTVGEMSRSLIVKSDKQRKAIEEILAHYVKVLEGVEEKTRLSEIASDCLQDYYRKRLKSWHWSSRMNALYHIEDFQITGLLEDVLKLTRKRRISNERRYISYEF